jgi:cytochrome c biogenesis protein CcdA
MSVGDILIAFGAGGLTVLNPCVLPILPIIFATAVSKHRYGPLALAAGLTVSFVAIVLFVNAVGFWIGLDADKFRIVGAVILILASAVLLVPPLQVQLAAAAGPVANWTQRRFGGLEGAGWQGQFGIGLVLGLVWSPCTGPTLGAAIGLASQGESLASVAVVLVAFGIGTAIPLLALGLLSRAALMRWRDKLMSFSRVGRYVLGGALLVVGLLIVTGLDRQIETFWLENGPTWLNDLTVRY